MNSVGFLKLFHPEGPWVLTAIKTDGKKIDTKTFGPSTEEEATKWIASYNSKRNLYFHVNSPAQALTRKASLADIAVVSWLHVDVDTRAGEDRDEELERIRVLLAEKCPVQSPTAIIFSGGGYQAFWKLDTPIEVKGEQHAAEIAGYNRQLELTLGGDNCHNIDRIMRLPDTMNLPNARKVAKGRIPVLSEVYRYNPDDVYSLDTFTLAPPLQVAGVDSSDTTTQLDTGNIKFLDSVDELDKWEVPDRIKVIIVQGRDPDNPKLTDNSRSAWVFDAVCQLLRASVPDDVIISILLDPDLGISASVLEKKPRHMEYALKQIRSGKDFVIEPWLKKLNERYAVIGNLGGRCLVVEEVFDPSMKRDHVSKQSFADFQRRYQNVHIQVDSKTVEVGKWWLRHPRRREFEYMIFSPGREINGAYNLWQGFGVQPLPGEQHARYLEHIQKNICGGEKHHYEYLLGWMARAIQQPDTPGETAVVLRGRSGTGKSFFAKHLGKLFGRHFLQVSDAKHLVGAFNAHLRDCVLLFGDEAFYAGDKKHESVLKTLITEERMLIEPKGVDAEVSGNFVHLIMASNEDWVVPSGPAERRFFVLDVGTDHQQDNTYFGEIVKDMNTGGHESLLHFLLNYNLNGYDVRQVPMTTALFDQKIHSMDPFSEWWFWRLQEGTLLKVQDKWESRVPCEELFEDYLIHTRQFGMTRLGNKTRLGRFLSKVCPGAYPRRVREGTGGTRPYFYHFPTLKSLRKKWEQLYGGAIPWAKEEKVENVAPPF